MCRSKPNIASLKNNITQSHTVKHDGLCNHPQSNDIGPSLKFIFVIFKKANCNNMPITTSNIAKMSTCVQMFELRCSVTFKVHLSFHCNDKFAMFNNDQYVAVRHA